MSLLALELYRSVPRYVAARAASRHLPGLVAGPVAPLRLVTRDAPRPPAEGWARVKPRLAGICGSDLAAVSGRASFYFSPLISLPFVPGHEVVGELLDDLDDLPAGTRVVLDPVLGCAARGVEPCDGCASGARERCDRVTVGHIAPGMQTGYCEDTSGGWSQQLVAHRSQLHAIDDDLADDRAVLVEPLACAIHAALRAGIAANDRVLVVGAGSVGLLTLLALRAFTQAGEVTVVAKHAKQAELAGRFGATTVVRPRDAIGSVRRLTHALRLDPERGAPFLLGGADVALDCVGSSDTLDLALRSTRAGGRVVLTGMPTEKVDLTPAWYRELEVVGAYASGTEQLDTNARSSPPAAPTLLDGRSRSTFDLAVELARDAPLDGVVGATYPLHRWREALDHALSAGRLGTLKVTFEPHEE